MSYPLNAVDEDEMEDDHVEVSSLYDYDIHNEDVPKPPEDEIEETPLSMGRPHKRRRIERGDGEQVDPSSFIHKFDKPNYFGRDKSCWSTNPLMPRRRSDSTDPNHHSHPKGLASVALSCMHCFRVIFYSNLLSQKVENTDLYIVKMC